VRLTKLDGRNINIRAVERLFFNRFNRVINYFNRALIVALTHISFVLCYR